MLKNLYMIGGFLLLLNLPALAAEAGYSSVIEDLPLMPGMVEKADDAVVFDKPGGRIIETISEIAATPAEINKFYTDTLPPLGWEPLPHSVFVRENESLQLNMEKKGKVTIVHFNLAPSSKGK
ncbi:MAG: hypothetical protein HY052_07120 [Proteobacteria bacterium]|nr:hypothetical protein [Pseudomonadota bacterium]